MKSDENTSGQEPENINVVDNPKINPENQFYNSFAYQENSLFYCHRSPIAGQAFFHCTEDDMEIDPEKIPFEPCAAKENDSVPENKARSENDLGKEDNVDLENDLSIQAQTQITHNHQAPSHSSPSDKDFIDLLSGEAVALTGNDVLDWNLESDEQENKKNPKMRF